MSNTHYLGTAGQLAVMSELAVRGYNVAIPEIDIGDDIFAVNDVSGHLWRIQVKTATARETTKGFSVQFRIRSTAISMPMVPELHFVFVIRYKRRWRFVVISREVLNNYVIQGLGTPSPDGVSRQLYFSYKTDEAGSESLICSGMDILHHRNDWTRWPELT